MTAAAAAVAAAAPAHVIPAKAGIHAGSPATMDPGFRRGDVVVGPGDVAAGAMTTGEAL